MALFIDSTGPVFSPFLTSKYLFLHFVLNSLYNHIYTKMLFAKASTNKPVIIFYFWQPYSLLGSNRLHEVDS